MHPILARFTIGGEEVVLRSYSTFYVLAWAVVISLATIVAWRRGAGWWKALLVFALSLVIGIVGARMLDLAVNWGYYADDLDRIYDLGFRGFSLYGGLILAAAAGVLLSRAFKENLWRLADSTIPALVAGIALMRTGCFLNGCCFGTTTSLPWGVRFPAGSPAWSRQILTGETGLFGLAAESRPVHPTQLYEIAAVAVFGGLALWLLLRRRSSPAGMTPAGVPFLVFALGFTLFRLADDFLRAKPSTATRPEWLYPAMYGVICLLAGALIAERIRNSRRSARLGGETNGD